MFSTLRDIVWEQERTTAILSVPIAASPRLSGCLFVGADKFGARIICVMALNKAAAL